MAISEKHKKAYARRLKKTPTGDRLNEVTSEKWKVFLQWIANGASRGEACSACKVSNQTVQAYLISEAGSMQALRSAERSWIRRDWPVERIDEFLTWVSMGKTNKDAALMMDFMDGELDQLMKVILHDPSVKKMYDEARVLQAESWADDMVQISDDGSNDTIEVESKTGRKYIRTDYDVVNRSKLRVATRQWLMARMHPDRFGDRIQQTIDGDLTVNHSDILDDARKRKENADQKRKQLTAKTVSEDTPPNRVH